MSLLLQREELGKEQEEWKVEGGEGREGSGRKEGERGEMPVSRTAMTTDEAKEERGQMPARGERLKKDGEWVVWRERGRSGRTERM